MLHKFSITIPPLTDTKERRGYVYLPDSYHSDTDKHYPVIYMFDGQNVFHDEDATYGKSWRLGDYLTANHKELIVVAIECNREGNERLFEYTPFDFSFEPVGDIQSKGTIYMDWLTGTLKPQIDSHLRTLSDRKNTILCGSSMGGLMSLYGAIAYNKYFGRAACLSPSLWISPADVENLIEASKIRTDTQIYMDYGSKELNFRKEIKEVLLRTTSLLVHKDINVTFRIVYGGKHNETTWSKQIPVFMECLGL